MSEIYNLYKVVSDKFGAIYITATSFSDAESKFHLCYSSKIRVINLVQENIV